MYTCTAHTKIRTHTYTSYTFTLTSTYIRTHDTRRTCMHLHNNRAILLLYTFPLLFPPFLFFFFLKVIYNEYFPSYFVALYLLPSLSSILHPRVSKFLFRAVHFDIICGRSPISIQVQVDAPCYRCFFVVIDFLFSTRPRLNRFYKSVNFLRSRHRLFATVRLF